MAWREHQQRVLDEIFPVVRETMGAREYKGTQAYNMAHNVLRRDHFNLEVGTHVSSGETGFRSLNERKFI